MTLRDLSVGRRLAVGFGVVISLLALVLTIAFWSLGRLDGSASRVNRVVMPLAASADQLRFEVAALLAAQSSYVLDRGSSRPTYESVLQQVRDGVTTLVREADTVEQHVLLAKIASEVSSLDQIDGTIWDSVKRGDMDRARNLVLGPGFLAVNYLQDDAQLLASLARAEQAGSVRSFQRVVSSARSLLAVLGGLAVAAAAALAAWIGRTIRRPIVELEQAARRAAGGDLSISVVAQANDETGRLVDAFNQMVSGLRRSVDNTEYDHQLRTALEMADVETSVLQVTGEALQAVSPDEDRSSELLLADSSRAHLRQAVVRGPVERGPCCPVESPFSCAAVRGGQALTFRSSEELGACPQLKNRPYGAVSATCVPVTFMGRAVGVIHTIGPNHVPIDPDAAQRLSVLASHVGTRLGTVRAFARTHLQAATDPLTGLLNRRSVEARVHELELAGTPYAVILCDLDHFKRLNDTYGHEMGDKALRVFAGVVGEAIRPDDVAARFGGEEFLLVLPNCSVERAFDVGERVRARLAKVLHGHGEVPAYTVSLGVAGSYHTSSLEEAIRCADRALYEAKERGRDRTVVAEGHLDDVEDELEPDVAPRERTTNGGRTTIGLFAHLDEHDPVMDTMVP